MSKVMQFGIPSFDSLMGCTEQCDGPSEVYQYDAYGIQLAKKIQTTSFSVIGPDGTGKSVFGLHLAAQYLADADLSRISEDGEPWVPRVLYVSTDLKHHVANVMWEKFGLMLPNKRDFPFYWAYRRDKPNSDRIIELARLDPEDIQRAVIEVDVKKNETKVHFIDLVSKTMGDDWGFINRLVAVLRMPPEGCEPHLLIIDAVEGFETLVGEKDAFGETTSRRARIAQIMRTGGDKCHVCFIVEEPKSGERFPEEFVTDVVIRLRCTSVNNYSRRTVEVVKARGQAHARGQHQFTIREKPRQRKPDLCNADEPLVANSYVHVFPSLHILSREEMRIHDALIEPRKDRIAAFGIKYLDEMLTSIAAKPSRYSDNQGLRVQTNTALIGEFATQKTSLAVAFLARTFGTFAFELTDLIRDLIEHKVTPNIVKALEARANFESTICSAQPDESIKDVVEEIIRALKMWNAKSFERAIAKLKIASAQPLQIKTTQDKVRFAAWLAEGLEECGAAVLITTSNQDREGLVTDLSGWLNATEVNALTGWPTFDRKPLPLDYQGEFKRAVQDHIRKRTVCRRLELHDLSSATLFQIVQRSVGRAQECVFLSEDLSRDEDRLPFKRSVRFRRSWNIRVVIDDLSTLKDAYPEIGSDPIFLPFLLTYLEREGVTSLIVDSHMGRPDAIVTDALDRELRALVLHKILTWRVPFLGQMREAITVIPSDPGGLPSLVREVRWLGRESGPHALVVDPELELYSGLERGESPKQIPLEIRLYAETAPTVEYIREQNEILGQLFTPLATNPEAKVIVGMESWPYDSLRDFCNLQTQTPLDHTMMFQVDEFWVVNRKAHSTGFGAETQQSGIGVRKEALYSLEKYLTEPTSIRTPSNEVVADRVVDPFGAFQGEPISQKMKWVPQIPTEGPWQRRHYFTRSAQGRGGEHLEQQSAHRSSGLGRVDRIPYTWDFGFLLCPSAMWMSAAKVEIGYKDFTVNSVWEQMPSVISRTQQPYLSWRKFLGACKAVAQAQSEQSLEVVRALDVSTLAGESFTCMILEIWASEIYDVLDREAKRSFFDALGHIDEAPPFRQSLIRWLDNPRYVLAFYKSWLLLLDVVDLSDVVDRQTIPRLKVREADGKAAATRHWYKTACGHQHCPITNELSVPVRLPGHFSVRGDWFLAVAGGSRSERLAWRALDLFSTRRANFRRMELGIGLPTRDIADKDSFKHLSTALLKRTGGRTSAVSYAELIGTDIERRDHFSWLWRSQLHDYHRHSRLLQRWIGEVAETWEHLQKTNSSSCQSGFDVYDQLENLQEYDGMNEHLLTWAKFKELCSHLRNQLHIASQSSPDAKDLATRS